MNYEKQIYAFVEWLQKNMVTPSAQLLYHTLVALNGQSGWEEWFGYSNQSLCAILNISKNTLKKAREELVSVQLIDYIPGSKKGDMTKYRITFLHKGSENDPKIESEMTKGSNIDPLKDKNMAKGSIFDPKTDELAIKGSKNDPESHEDKILGSIWGPQIDPIIPDEDVVKYEQEESGPESQVSREVIDAWS